MSTTELAEPVEIGGFTVTEAVTAVTWTADGAGLAPHEFSEFALSAGPFPEDVDELTFPATQTYSDGEVVAWADPTVDGEEEPEHPAPVLALGGTGDEAGGDANGDGGSDTIARTLGIAGVALGAVGVITAVRTRRAGPTVP